MTREHSEEPGRQDPPAVSSDRRAADSAVDAEATVEITGPPGPAAASGAGSAQGAVSGGADGAGGGETQSAGVARLRPRGGTVTIAVLLALLGFSLVVQVKSNSADSSFSTARQEDLVRILSDLEAQEERLRQEIAELEESQRQLTSGVQGRRAALEEATRQADELGILAGTLPATGPGLDVRFVAGSKPLRASTILDAVQELRGAGAEAMQITGANGVSVRIIASTAFLDADDGISAGGKRLTGPYTITVIGDPNTMRTALNIPGGVVASVRGDGGNVTIEERAVVDVSALAAPVGLRHARPVS